MKERSKELKQHTKEEGENTYHSRTMSQLPSNHPLTITSTVSTKNLPPAPPPPPPPSSTLWEQKIKKRHMFNESIRHKIRFIWDEKDLTSCHLLTSLQTPLWIFDIENKTMYWANDSACTLWNTKSLQELKSKNYKDDMSISTKIRLGGYLKRFTETGDSFYDQWTFYPDGISTTVRCHCSPIYVESLKLMMLLIEGYVERIQQVSHDTLRGVEAMRHTSVMISLYNANDGTCLMRNPAAQCYYQEIDIPNILKSYRFPYASLPNGHDCNSGPKSDQCKYIPKFLQHLVHQDDIQLVVNKIQKEEKFRFEAEVKTVNCHDKRWHEIVVMKTKDPVTSEDAVLLNETDISMKKKVEEVSIRNLTAKIKAESDSKAKGDFIATLSHEIRTPMNGLLGFADILLHSGLNKEQEQFCHYVVKSANTLSCIINNVFEFTKLEHGTKKDLDTNHLRINILCQDVIELLQIMNDNNVDLICKYDPRLNQYDVVGDELQLKQVLINLVNNALKFTKEGSVVLSCELVDVCEEKQEIECKFSVVDTGIGIPEDKMKNIFDRYCQLSSKVHSRYEGVGLGLTICKEILAKMGSSIHVESTYGKGSKFWFLLKLKISNGCSDSHFQMDRCDEKLGTPPLKTFQCHGEQKKSSSSDNDYPFQFKTCLLTEDNQINQKVATFILKKMKINTVIANDGAEAVNMYKEYWSRNEPFDFVLMDINLPVLDGYQATEKIRQFENEMHFNNRTIIIALTANTLPGDKDKALKCGMDDYISKPIQPSKLETVIKRCLNIQ